MRKGSKKDLKLRDVWRTCNKIRAAIFRVGLNLWDYYKPLDPNNENLLSESKFVSVLTGPLRGPIGLSDAEIGELADYFRIQDGRILYSQMCEVIHDSVPEFDDSKTLVTGLEWEDPLHVNRVSLTERRRLNLLITKIAVLLNKRKLTLRPYFQDYELDILDQFPGRVLTAELPKLPRPEIGKIAPSKVFGKQSTFHPVMDEQRAIMPVREIIQRLQRHVLERRIRIHEFFKDFDVLNVGRVTVSQFKRGLDALQVSSLGHLYLAEQEIDSLTALYKDPNDPDRVCWRTFEDDVDHVFTVKELEKLPMLGFEQPPPEIAELSKKGQKNWQSENKSVRELCEECLEKIRHRVEERRILLKQFFKDYDKLNHGHVTRNQMRQVLKIAVILLSREEIFALEQRYNDDQGFHYSWFLEELEARPIESPFYRDMLDQKKRINAPRKAPQPTVDETNIVAILAKIKAKVVRERINVSEFMKPFDVRNEQVISRQNFVRGLDQLRCNLSCAEVTTIMEVFKAPLRYEFVEYTRFASVVEEAVATGSLEKAPLLVPVQHVPSEACGRSFLNFEERRLFAQAMDKLVIVKHPNLEEIFADFDKENIGTVTKDRLIKALSVRNMLPLISATELDVIHKCFSIERGSRLELDYRAFLRALHLLAENKKTLPF